MRHYQQSKELCRYQSDLIQTQNSWTFAIQIPWLKRLRCWELESMKVLILFSVLNVTIFILLQHVSSILTLDKETYDLFVQLIKGEFTVSRQE